MPHTAHPYGVYVTRDNIVPPDYLPDEQVQAGKQAARDEIAERTGVGPTRKRGRHSE